MSPADRAETALESAGVDTSAAEPVASESAGVGPSPGPPTDSAGVPWAGRTLTAQPFAGDDGTTDPTLLAALTEWSAAGETARLAEVVRAWAPTRVLVPIVAVLGEGDDVRSAAEHGQGDKSADMALVTITGRDGRRILPTFTSTAALAAWNPSARPVPVEAARAAQAAVLEECDLIAIDLDGPISCLLPRPAVWAVAQGRDWTPPAEDRELLDAVAGIAAAVPGLAAHRLEPDGVAGLNVVLGLPPGLTEEQVQQVVGRTSQLLAATDLITERADSLRLTVLTV